MVLQSDAVQGVALLNVSAQVDDVLQSLLGRAPPEPFPATRPQLVALPVLLRQVVLRGVVSKQVCMTAVGRLHHGGRLESIVLAPAGHFHFPARTRTEISICVYVVRLRNTFCATSVFRRERRKNGDIGFGSKVIHFRSDFIMLDFTPFSSRFYVIKYTVVEISPLTGFYLASI